MIRYPKRLTLFLCGALALWLPAAGLAQPYIYPQSGQTPQQQESEP